MNFTPASRSSSASLSSAVICRWPSSHCRDSARLCGSPVWGREITPKKIRAAARMKIAGSHFFMLFSPLCLFMMQQPDEIANDQTDHHRTEPEKAKRLRFLFGYFFDLPEPDLRKSCQQYACCPIPNRSAKIMGNHPPRSKGNEAQYKKDSVSGCFRHVVFSPFAKCFFAASIIAGNRAPRHWRLPHFSRPAFGSNAFTLYNGPRRHFATASLTFFLRYCKMGKVSS